LFFSRVHLVWASSVKKCYSHTVWVLELIQRHNSNRLHMSAVSRGWMRCIWYRYIPSVWNAHQSVRVEVSISGLNSRANSESEM